MYRFFVPLLVLILFGCSSTVHGVERDVYKQAEKYANQLYDATQNEEDRYNFDNEALYNFLVKNEGHKMIDVVGALYFLNSRVIAEDTETSYPSKKTMDQIEEMVDILEDDYSMNIR